MPEIKPILLRRVLTLRQFPLFAAAALDELATMAENLISARFPAGALVAPAQSRVAAVQLVISGSIESRPHGLTWGPRSVFGALEVAANRELADAVVAVTDTETLQLPAADFSDVLEDNFGVLISALRELSGRLIESALPPAKAVAVTSAAGPLGLVERLILLRQQLPFAKARLQPLAMLAHASEELDYPVGSILASAGDPATCGIVLVEGSLRAHRDGGPTHALGPGQHFGFVETLALAQHSYTLEATSQLRVLASPGPAILDVLEDHTDVGVAMITAFATALLDTLLN
jgi:CRP-like cAMP-binding protein